MPSETELPQGGECRACGYDMRGLPPMTPCPECGEPGFAFEPGLIPSGVHCYRCDADLAGLSNRGFCMWCQTYACMSVPPAYRDPEKFADEAEPIRCARCTHQLLPNNLDGDDCPKCELPAIVTLEVYAHEMRRHTGGIVQTDLACRKCRYNLRNLDIQQYCPECGLLVWCTLAPDHLGLADPDWLGTIERGLRRASYAIILLPFVLLATFFIMFVPQLRMLTPFLTILLALLATHGGWVTMTPEPERAAHTPNLTRITAAYGLISLALYPLAPLLPPLLMLPGGSVRLVGLVLYTLHLRRLAARLPRPPVRLAETLIGVWLLILGPMAVSESAYWFDRMNNLPVLPEGWMSPCIIVGPVAGLLLLALQYQIAREADLWRRMAND